MSRPPRMHAGEVDTDVALVARLIAAQFPAWAGLPIEIVRSSGTDHAMYRLGGDRVVRLPRIAEAVAQLEKEHRYLPRLAPRLPLGVPVPLALGAPGEGFPFPWSVYGWLEGENATLERLHDIERTARDLAAFIQALHAIDPRGGPAPGAHNAFRGVSLAERDLAVRGALAALHGQLDVPAAAAAWEAALAARPLTGAPVWIHGDLQSGNLLASGGRLSAVIDFGCLGVGDPACDLSVAWSLLPPEARLVLRQELRVDDATWQRGRGWALSIGLVALPYYERTNPVLAGIARHAIEAVLTEPQGSRIP